MKFSIITPIYNTSIEKLGKCIDSVRKQKFEIYEHILVNDGSVNTKNIEKYIKKLQKKDKNLIYIYQLNLGSAVARNTGLNNVTGDYIMFVDADDELVDGFYNNFKMHLNKDLADVIFFDYTKCNNINKEYFNISSNSNDIISLKDDILSNILYYPNKMNDYLCGSIWGKCFSKKFIKNNKIMFIDKLRKAQDRRFMLEVLINAKKMYYYPIHSYIYFSNDDSICHKINFKMVDYYYYLYMEITSFILKNKINKSVSKFFVYSIFNELLLLTVFHSKYKDNYFKKKKKYKEIYKKFSIDLYITDLNISDFPSFNSKLRFFLIKYNCFFLLIIVSLLKQRKDNKNNFK